MCCLSNILSLFIILPVVAQVYTANVMDESVLKGNTAIFKCHIPSFVSDYVYVTSWVQDDTHEVIPEDDNYGVFAFLVFISRFSQKFSGFSPLIQLE